VRILDRILQRPTPARDAYPYTLGDYAGWIDQFMYNGLAYTGSGIALQQTLAGTGTERPAGTFEGLARQAFSANGVVFACMLTRQLAFSGPRFQWQRLRDGKASDTYGTPALQLLESPWPGGTTQDLLARMLQDADLAGNSYWYAETPLSRLGTNDPNKELVRLRPDWVEIIGLPRQADTRTGGRGDGQVGWRKLGYLYTENGVGSGGSVPFTVDEVAHFAPIPDPLGVFVGMSWLTPVIREIQADHAMTRYQRRYMDNGATPNTVIKHFPGAPGIQGATQDGVRKWIEEFEDKYAGIDMAGKTLHLYPGADATVIGSNLKEIDFKVVRGHGETRIAAAAGVPPIIVGLSEGLESATYSNYGQARRRFADGTMHPLWQNVAGSLQRIMPPPNGSRLWYDATDVPFLREDEKDAAEIQQLRAATIMSLISAGFEPDSAVAAVEANDFRGILKHTGMTSVQLQEPGSDANANTSVNTEEEQ